MEKDVHKSFCFKSFEQIPIIGILRNIEIDTVARILPLFESAGLTSIEITMNSPGAEAIISYASSEFGDKLNIGAGTVCNEESLEKALNAGAQFIVTPIVQENLIRSCVSQNIPVFPGAYTPTEIAAAWNLKAPMVKVFPARSLGPDYFRDILAPLNHIKLIATGGMTLNNIESYLDAGVHGFGIGSPLFPKSLIGQEDWNSLAAHFNLFKEKYDSAKTKLS